MEVVQDKVVCGLEAVGIYIYIIYMCLCMYVYFLGHTEHDIGRGRGPALHGVRGAGLDSFALRRLLGLILYICF